jgi:hypothetical protein
MLLKNITMNIMENKAKEKARQLIEKYNLVVLDTAVGGSNIRVKQCALIAVDEMINEYKQNSTFAQLEWVDYRIAFLKEVKIELNLL